MFDPGSCVIFTRGTYLVTLLAPLTQLFTSAYVGELLALYMPM
jgi:hypothetical protein